MLDIEQLLNYYVVLALSKQNYKEFDDKSVAFIENGLDLIDKKFSGSK